MSGSNFGDSMGWGNSGRSSPAGSSRKGKRGGGGGGAADKPKQPQRGLGVAQLEKIRLQSEMAEYFSPLGQQPGSLVHRTGSLNLMAYGERGDVRYSEFQTPIIRSPSSSNIYGAPHYAHPNITLPLFEPEESARLKGHHDRSHSADSTSMNSDDPQDVDLELKL
ncbi:protein SPEAR3-like isoform X2 [Oryza brachyantha]|uniref:protein SPEAR3-like isoform X2 n=1 Tax=Oryza brachyantha TaxID=4533 RepID=UPI001ADA0D97|nr:protein SPEAR3-like isoform X2 [Oryza brachyantha]